MVGKNYSFRTHLSRVVVRGHAFTLIAICAVCASMLVSWQLSMGDDQLRPWFVALTCMNGAVLGSATATLVNVFVFRLPRRLPLLRPWHSICPSCRRRIKIVDMLPVIGFVVIRGRCRHCGLKVPARYLILELVLGTAWAAIWFHYLVVSWRPFNAVAATFVATCLAGWTCFALEERGRIAHVIKRSNALSTSGS